MPLLIFPPKASLRTIGLLALVWLWAACSPRNPYNHTYVSDQVKKQSQFDLIKKKEPGRFDLPPDVQATDGLTEDEAVAVALWNNAQFQADLIALKFAQADLTEAGQMQNPTFRYLSPNGGIVAQTIAYLYVDAMLQRPFRIAASKRDAKKVADNLAQRTFTLIRDVQSAYADLSLARQKAAFLKESTQVRTEIANLSRSRLRNGDISELEATSAQVDSVGAIEAFLRLAQDTIIMNNRFNNLLGVINQDTTIRLQSTVLGTPTVVNKSELLDLAYTNQPEIKAAMAGIEAAGKRLGWERSRVLAFSLVLNGQNFANTPSAENAFPQTFDLGAQIEVPIFNRNRGRILRAKAEMEQAAFQYLALRQRIAIDLSEAYERYQVAAKSYQLWRGNVLPSLTQAVKLAQDNYRIGDISYLPVLEATRAQLDAKLRKAEVEAELYKAIAQLNFRIGKKTVSNGNDR